ncbi:MAG: hypothetical protein Kow0029_09350 [Candidatus Rifleibacteriota bacterium]
MSENFWILALTAVNIGFFHTVFGPDHYLPFIVMSRAGEWSKKKTMLITLLCGIGHVLSSIVLGFIGIGFGIVVSKLELIEEYRGNLAAWLLIAFGFLYMVWGVKQAVRGVPHTHLHSHDGLIEHSHEHIHEDDHVHAHVAEEKSMTPWILFTIFVFGPCEPLIPLLMYPAAKGNLVEVFGVASVFGVVTVSTMMAIVLVSIAGISLISLKSLEKYTHALAGATICASGLAIKFLGL